MDIQQVVDLETGWVDADLVDLLTDLINLMLEYKQVPSQFLFSEVIPLFKGGTKDPEDPTSYRPINPITVF